MARIVLTGSIEHETNTFSIVRTGLDAFRRRTFLVNDTVADLDCHAAQHAVDDHGITRDPVDTGTT